MGKITDNNNNSIKIISEKPYPLGCYIDYDRSLVVRAVFGDAKKCGITLYKNGDHTDAKPLQIELPSSLKRGAIYSARISGIDNIAEYASYNYFADGEYFCDPYAKQFYGLEKFGKDVPDSEIRSKLDNKADFKTSHDTFDWKGDEHPFTPYENSFVYLLHVRGFTKSPSSQVTLSKRGTFNGILEKIPYLKSLNVTAVELMPCYEMNEMEDLYLKSDKRSYKGTKGTSEALFSKDGSIISSSGAKNKLNFWGYKKGYYFAPRTAYCENPSDSENEFKQFIRTMHENSLEVIMQFYFEDNESKPLIIDALRFWRCTYHVDGFHLKGKGVPIDLIVSDPLFTDIKIWYDWFDINSYYEGKKIPVRLLGEYNNSFLYNTRRFLKSDDNCASDFLKSMIANPEDHGVINYICDYEGFRLADLVSYEHKHNEENGENNKDGTDNNLSWNCGVEGRTRKHVILTLRNKQIKNALSMLFLSQGTPMIFSGDEFASSQSGNNNPYCQDNEIGWVDWKAIEKNADILEYTRFLTSFRFSNPILHRNGPFKLMDQISCGYPDFSCHGNEAYRPDLSGHSHMLGMLYCGLYEKDSPFIYVCYNFHWDPLRVALPKLPDGLKWKLISDTDKRGLVPEIKESKGKNKGPDLLNDINKFTELVADRSVRIYISEQDKDYVPSKKKKQNIKTDKKSKEKK